MKQLERQIRSARRRLLLNLWLYAASVCLAVAAACFSFFVLTTRIFDVHEQVPLFWSALGLALTALSASVLWCYLARPSAEMAAARLDEAAGLRERISSGRYCLGAADPFAAAVVADAERISGAIRVRSHLRLSMPRPLPYTSLCVLLAALMFLVPPGWLKGAEATQAAQVRQEFDTTKVAVKRQLEALREAIPTSPELDELKEELNLVDPKAGGLIRKPEDIRHEASKKIDDLSDMVKHKQEKAEYGATKEMEKMLRGLKPLGPTESPTEKLSDALADGDFKAAKEEIQAIKEQLATLKSDDDKELAEKLGKQLEELAKQIDELAKDQKLAEKLEQAGVDPETAKRLLENLSKKDLEQIKKALEESGLSKEKIEQLAKQLQQKQQGGQMAKQLAQAMKKAGQAAGAGGTGDAAQGLSMAADQLSELEQLQQEMAQLDAAANALREAQSSLDKPCSHCKGTGQSGGGPCPACKGGGGMGPRGRGRGGLAPEEQTNMAFKVERTKVKTQQGAIIGQFFVEGEQVKGEVSKSFTEIVTAAEREASDRINRDRIPRQYQSAIKEYFSHVRETVPSAGDRVGPGEDAGAADSGGESKPGADDKD